MGLPVRMLSSPSSAMIVVPEACLLHASRHPADSALSAFQQSFYPDKVNWSVVSAVGGWGGGGGRGVLAAVGGAGEVV